jgi:hypothetical protein
VYGSAHTNQRVQQQQMQQLGSDLPTWDRASKTTDASS